MRHPAFALGALALLAFAATASPQAAAPQAVPAADERPALADRLGWNSRERTAAGIEALEKGDAPAAKAALDTALRLRPADPTARYNAGTGRLAAGDPSAGELLDRAAREAPNELAPAAWYNLGEARFGARDLRGAADAFIETLKRQPEHANAKHNLELALREIEKQRQQQQQQQDNQKNENQDQESRDEPNENPGGQKPTGAGGDQKPNDDPRQNQPGPGGDDQDPQPRPAANDPNDPNAPPQKKPGALPQFHDLPDMTADQAAAILRAVDNLERQQRQARAAKAAQTANAGVEIDW